MLRNDFETQLKDLIKRSGTSQAALAEEIKTTHAYVNRIVKGKVQIVNRMFIDMMEQMGYDVEVVFIPKNDNKKTIREILNDLIENAEKEILKNYQKK